MGLVGWIVIGVVVVLLLWGVAIYNGLVRLRALVREASAASPCSCAAAPT